MQSVKTAAFTALAMLCWGWLGAPARGQEASEPDGDHFQVGIAADVTPATTQEAVDEFLVGPSVTHRWGFFGLGGQLMLGPAGVVDDLRSADSDVEGYRGLLGLHARAALRLGGVEWTYGVGAHLEARLKDHFWLMYLTPLELGALLYEEGSWRVRALTGMRVATEGELINIFLLDPNGFDNRDARDELSREKGSVGFFFGIVFARRID